METPTVVVERERERVNNSPSFPRRHKLIFGLVVTIGVIIYAAFNVWVYRYSTSDKGHGESVKRLNPKGFQGLTFTDPPPSPTPSPSLTPSPRLTGPGKYACDEYGICNNYEDAKRVGCPKTYADPHCLNECGDKKVRCLKPK